MLDECHGRRSQFFVNPSAGTAALSAFYCLLKRCKCVARERTNLGYSQFFSYGTGLFSAAQTEK